MSDILIDTSESAVVARMEIQRALGRVEGKLDTIITGIASHETLDQHRFEEVNEIVQKMDNRQRSMERKIWYAAGIGGTLVFLVSKIPFGLLFK